MSCAVFLNAIILYGKSFEAGLVSHCLICAYTKTTAVRKSNNPAFSHTADLFISCGGGVLGNCVLGQLPACLPMKSEFVPVVTKVSVCGNKWIRSDPVLSTCSCSRVKLGRFTEGGTCCDEFMCSNNT